MTVARGQLDRATGALRPAVLQRQVDSARHRLESTWRLVADAQPRQCAGARLCPRHRARRRDPDVSAAVTAAGAVTLRFRDGSVDVAVDPGDGKTPDKPRRVERSAPKAYAAPIPEQPTLL